MCAQYDPDANGGKGQQVVAVAYVPKAREIVYKDRKFGMECTHLVVPGMVVEKIQKRPLKNISFDMQAVAKYMNEYRFKTDGPLNILFQEEVVDGKGKGFPYVIAIADHNTKLHQAQAQRGRRGSILGKIGGEKSGEVDQEVIIAQRHARRMSVDARKMSTTGSGADDAAAAATAAHARAMGRVPSVDEERIASMGRGGRRGSVSSHSSSHNGEQTMPSPAGSRGAMGGRRGSVSTVSMEEAAQAATGRSTGGRRGSVSAMSLEEAARTAAAATMMASGDNGSRSSRAGGRRSSVSSNSSHGGRRSSVHSQDSEDQAAELEAGGMLTGSAYPVSFKSQGDGIRGEKLQLQVGRTCVALYEKNGQPHSHYKYTQLAAQNYVKTVDKGFVIQLATGRDLVFKAKFKEAAQIAQEVTMAKLTWDELKREDDGDSEEEEQQPEDAHTDLMQPGARVMVSGLQSEAAKPFNGMLGTVVQELDESIGRLGVEFDNGKTASIRPVNTLPLNNGVKVQVTGLTSELGKQFNGSLARILDYDAGIGRYSVMLETGQTTRIKPINAGRVSDDPEVQRRLRKFDGRESEQLSEEESSSEDDDGKQANLDSTELSWPDEDITQWSRLACTFPELGQLGIVWAESEPPGGQFNNEMLVVSKIVSGSAAAAKQADGLQQYAVLRKVNGLKIGKKATDKVLAMVDAPRAPNEPLQLEFAVPVFEKDEPRTPEKRQTGATGQQPMAIGSLHTMPSLMQTSIDEKRDLEEQELETMASPRPTGMPSPRPPTPALTNLLSKIGIEHLYDALAKEGCHTLEDLKTLQGIPGVLENIGFRPLQLRRLTIALTEEQQDDSITAATALPTAAAAEVASASASRSVGRPTGSLGATPTATPKVPRRNVYISPFMTQQDQEEEVVRVRRLMTELKVPGGTLRRVMPGKREWHITPL